MHIYIYINKWISQWISTLIKSWTMMSFAQSLMIENKNNKVAHMEVDDGE